MVRTLIAFAALVSLHSSGSADIINKVIVSDDVGSTESLIVANAVARTMNRNGFKAMLARNGDTFVVGSHGAMVNVMVFGPPPYPPTNISIVVTSQGLKDAIWVGVVPVTKPIEQHGVDIGVRALNKLISHNKKFAQ